VNLFKDLMRRLLRSRGWIAAQFGGSLLLILLGLAWTRLPEKHLWQVALSLLLPLLLIAAFLTLQAATMRRMAGESDERSSLALGAASLLVWVLVGWAAWLLLNWCDDQFETWASFLNSKAPAHWRAKLLTEAHIQHWLILLEWVCRWIVVPAKVIPYAVASAQWSWRLPWRRALRLLWNWRWWLGVVVAALGGVLLPSHFFNGTPHGTASAQLWAVGLKLTGAYLLAVCFWVLLLAWVAALFGRQSRPADPELTEVPVLVGPPEPELQAAVKLPLPEESERTLGDAGS
jgi:hypothetical protein